MMCKISERLQEICHPNFLCISIFARDNIVTICSMIMYLFVLLNSLLAKNSPIKCKNGESHIRQIN